jgi:hypothetical protein
MKHVAGQSDHDFGKCETGRMDMRGLSRVRCGKILVLKKLKRLIGQSPLLKAGTNQGNAQDHSKQNGGACASQND